MNSGRATRTGVCQRHYFPQVIQAIDNCPAEAGKREPKKPCCCQIGAKSDDAPLSPSTTRTNSTSQPREELPPAAALGSRTGLVQFINSVRYHVNDPYAGSPTKTLLRLLLPLNDQA